MSSRLMTGRTQDLAILGSVAVGLCLFVSLFAVLGTSLPLATTPMIVLSLVGGLSALLVVAVQTRHGPSGVPAGAMALLALICAGTVMALLTLFHVAAYISLPADILSFSEGNVVNNILKLRLGLPLYTAPEDNNSSMYTPGTELLIYAVSSHLGYGDSIPFYRVVQFSFVVAAAVVATSICDLLARRFLSPGAYSARGLWLAVWFLLIFVVCTDPTFNLYTHALHNDGPALLISVLAFWLIARHALAPRPWLLVAMAILPALGFMFKQNQLMWGGIFIVYLTATGSLSWRHLLLFALSSILLVLATVAACYLLWGDHFLWWVFTALGQKRVFLPRSIMHLFQAGIYAVMGLAAGWVLVLRNDSWRSAVIWGCWLLVFGIQVFTSGFAWQVNHIGPGVVLATCWFLVALAKVWPSLIQQRAWWRRGAEEASAAASVVLLFGGLGLIREPVNPVPPDFYRYVSAIEQEFSDAPTDKVLLDYGSWIYLRQNVEMRDRGQQVSLHNGKNQETSHDKLHATIERIRSREYEKILARQLDTEHSSYDFQDRGSGVKSVMFANYHVVRRIGAVEGIRQWWPLHMVEEILVLVPNHNEHRAASASTADPDTQARDR